MKRILPLAAFAVLTLLACRGRPIVRGEKPGTPAETVAGRDPTTAENSERPSQAAVPTPADGGVLLAPPNEAPAGTRSTWDAADGEEADASLEDVDMEHRYVALRITTSGGLIQREAGREYQISFGELPALTGLPADEALAKMRAEPRIRVKLMGEAAGSRITAIQMPASP